jgi:hypothetical protein
VAIRAAEALMVRTVKLSPAYYIFNGHDGSLPDSCKINFIIEYIPAMASEALFVPLIKL